MFQTEKKQGSVRIEIDIEPLQENGEGCRYQLDPE